MSLNFEWNSHKARRNQKKHGVAFEEALTVFRDRTALIFDDDDHSENEYREGIIGYSEMSRLLIVIFTEREGKIRIISARRANRSESEDYEKAKR